MESTLKRPRALREDEIEIRAKKETDKGVVLLLYKTARTDMDLLDETFGAGNWQTDYKEIKGNLYCGIGVRPSEFEWVWRWNCGVESREDGEGNEKKGEASDALKRAGTLFGIGRELYTAPFIFVKTGDYTKNNKGKCNDTFKVEKIKITDGRITGLAIRNSAGKRVFVWQKAE